MWWLVTYVMWWLGLVTYMMWLPVSGLRSLVTCWLKMCLYFSTDIVYLLFFPQAIPVNLCSQETNYDNNLSGTHVESITVAEWYWPHVKMMGKYQHSTDRPSDWSITGIQAHDWSENQSVSRCCRHDELVAQSELLISCDNAMCHTPVITLSVTNRTLQTRSEWKLVEL